MEIANFNKAVDLRQRIEAAKNWLIRSEQEKSNAYAQIKKELYTVYGSQTIADKEVDDIRAKVELYHNQRIEAMEKGFADL